MIRRLSLLLLVLIVSAVGAPESDTPAISATELASRLSSLEEGTADIRIRMTTTEANTSKEVFQLQLKRRRTSATSDLICQILWPDGRRSEAVLLHKTPGNLPSGSVFVPPHKARPMSTSEINGPLFGSDLSCLDLIENFFAWKNQTLIGTEAVNGVKCLILESKQGDSEHSLYARVRSWIDVRRLVPMRIEKYLSSGSLARRIDTARITNDDRGRPAPQILTVRAGKPDSSTELVASRIRHGVDLSDADFTPEAMTIISNPRSTTQ